MFNFNTSDTYQQDWIGLRTLDAQGKVEADGSGDGAEDFHNVDDFQMICI